MRTLFLYILILANSIYYTKGQNNELTINDFNSIEIYGVLFSEIQKTDGDEPSLVNIFGNNISFIVDDRDSIGDGTRKVIVNAKFEFSFADINSNEFSPYLYYLKTNKIKIKGVTINIDDHYSILGLPLLIKEYNDNTKTISYTKLDNDCCVFVLETDQSGFITKIEYFVWT